jgi:adenylate kinase family enzyme
VRRVAVVGVTGSGKTTFARGLSARLGVPYVELDALHWQPNWTGTDPDQLRARVAQAVERPGWVIEGNYSKVRDLIWPAADTLVWLDYSLALVLCRLVRRTVRRSLAREMLWGTNRERFFPNFIPPNGLFPWLFKTHPQYRREYPLALRRPEYAHLDVVRLRTPA